MSDPTLTLNDLANKLTDAKKRVVEAISEENIARGNRTHAENRVTEIEKELAERIHKDHPGVTKMLGRAFASGTAR